MSFKYFSFFDFSTSWRIIYRRVYWGIIHPQILHLPTLEIYFSVLEMCWGPTDVHHVVKNLRHKITVKMGLQTTKSQLIWWRADCITKNRPNPVDKYFFRVNNKYTVIKMSESLLLTLKRYWPTQNTLKRGITWVKKKNMFNSSPGNSIYFNHFTMWQIVSINIHHTRQKFMIHLSRNTDYLNFYLKLSMANR